ncbi:MAG TPA: hypothetical protein VJ998_10360, partial [Pseudomonadales bacterium]|nr:hypothetical protein [Pseudomonadales bacterium]
MKTLTLLLTLALYLASPPVLATGDYFEYFYRDFDIGNADVAAEFQQVLRAVDQKNYSDASQLMSALVGKLDAAPNLDPGAHAQLLADAGILKASVFDNKAALDLLDKSDKMVVRYVGVYSPMLFNMLMAQGMVHSNVKDYPAAIESFRRAQHIVHRQDGVFSPKQIGVIDKIARVDQEQGSWLD